MDFHIYFDWKKIIKIDTLDLNKIRNNFSQFNQGT